MRLQKYLASCGIASRRKSEVYIISGRVSVNGKIIKENGSKVNEGDLVEVDGTPVYPAFKKYYVMNKPAGYLCSKGDRWGRKTLYDLLCDNDPSLFNVGRLDYMSSGLIILTNDGDFANSIMHPSKNIIKKYRVISKNAVPAKMIKKFQQGICIAGVKYTANNIINDSSDRCLLIELSEGKKREIREVYKYFGIEILELKRISIGGLRLENLKLKEGDIRSFAKSDLEKAVFSGKDEE